MKFMRLDRHNIALPDEAYTQIEQIIKQERLCGECYRKFTPDNPMVIEGKCLSCFLREENQLRFLDPLPKQKGTESEATTYQFIDPRGYIYLTHSFADRSEISMYRTIKHHGFPVAESFEGKRLTSTIGIFTEISV